MRALAVVAAVCGFISLIDASLAETVRANMFPGSHNMAVFVASEKGLFAKQGLQVEIQLTGSSQALRDDMINGTSDIAHAGVDNALAVANSGKADIVILAGGSNGMNELIVRPEITNYDQLRGKTMVVDAPNTAFALLLYKMLQQKGLAKDRDYGVLPAGNCQLRLQAMSSDTRNAAAMLNPPCSIIAVQQGFHSLGFAADVVGPYQADGIWVLKSYLASHKELLIKYLKAIIEARRWVDDPRNRDELAQIIAKHLNSDVGTESKAIALELGPAGGLAKDVSFDKRGFETTLALRAEFIDHKTPPEAAKYLDLSYYGEALRQLDRAN